MALLCKDVCRDLLPPQEYFDYGLWMPADNYRPESDESSSSASSDDENAKVASQAAEVDKANQAAIAAVKSEFSKKFDSVAGGSKTVTAEQAGYVARLLGFAPSQEEIRQLKAKSSALSQQDVSEWLKVVAHADDNVDNLIKFFQYYDPKNTGTVTRQQMSNLLRTYGEPLTEAEVNGILSDFGISGEHINYREFVDRLLAK